MAVAPELLSHQKVFNDYVRLRRHHLSCYHFSSIFLWQEFFNFDFKAIDGYLCVLAKHVFGTFLYLPPLGPGLNAAIIEKCFKKLNGVNSRPSFSRIENVSEEDLKYFDPKKYKFTEKSKEYCYLKEDIAHLRGNAFKSKRSSYNQFVKSHTHEFVPFEQRWEKDCVRLYDAWAKDRGERSSDDIYRTMLEENRGVHQLIFQHYDEIGLEGRLVLVDGEPQAYTFGYPLNEETFCVVVEITNLDLKGLSVYVFSRFCADDRLQSFKLINVMDDFAMNNVARTKKSFRPKALYSSYVVTERE